MYDFLVIGAGFSGIFACLSLTKKWPDKSILLIEAGSEILGSNSSSYNECYKLHLGFHYAGDKATAFDCLESSIAFIRANSDLLCKADFTPGRYGRHFVMKTSLFDPEAIRRLTDDLKNEYVRLIAEDPGNKVLGEPADFVRFLSRKDYDYISSEKKGELAFGVETAETQIDIVKARLVLARRLSQLPNFEAQFNEEVSQIRRLPTRGTGYTVSTQTRQFHARTIVNCAWHNVEFLNLGLDIQAPKNLFIRKKVSLLVSLPKELWGCHTCIFSIGPFISFTNIGSGKAILTDERTTNLGERHCANQDSGLSFGVHQVDSSETLLIAKNILSACTDYFPALSKALTLELRVGAVKTYVRHGQNLLLDSVDSAIHQRTDKGVARHLQGFFSVSGMKMTYSYSNSLGLVRMIKRDFQQTEEARTSREFCLL